MVHLEILGAVVGLKAVVVTVHKAQVLTTRILPSAEVDAGAFLRAVVVKAKDVAVQRGVQRERAAGAIEFDGFHIPDAPIACAKPRLANCADVCP